jgi:L-lysine 6-transaminase
MADKLYDYSPKFRVDAHQVRNDLANYMLVDGFDFVLDLDRSSGCSFVEARNGRPYLDFFTCFASMPVGMNHPKMIDEDFIKYLGMMAMNKPSNSDVYTEALATFVKTFFNIAVPDEFKYSFFIDGGALAVENALKAAFDRKVRKNIKKGIAGEKGHKVIHFRQAFHGRSGYTMSLTNTDPNKTKYFPQFEWPRIVNPKLEFPLTEEVIEKTEKLERQAEKEIKQAFADNPDDIAAIIVEPIQGEGGDNHFRPEFFRMLRRIADENDALLIFDEIQTGVGITGKWWAHQHFNVTPDILVFGKKMQICGILSTDRVDDEPENVFRTSSRINSTWGGSLVDMVRSTRYLEIIDEDRLVDNAAAMGTRLMENLVELEYDNKDIISNVRGQGLFCAFDLPTPAKRGELISAIFDEGMIILPCGEKSIRFRPPLNIDEDTIEKGIDIIKKCIVKIG